MIYSSSFSKKVNFHVVFVSLTSQIQFRFFAGGEYVATKKEEEVKKVNCALEMNAIKQQKQDALGSLE